MNGHILKEFPIAVDCFQKRTIGHVKGYFLTHMHSDHTVGLSSNWNHPIYCSFITSKLLMYKFNISSDLVHVLEENECHLLQFDQFILSVTAIPANHCPGSCMFLFETETSRVLYTGDFRLNSHINKFIEKINQIEKIIHNLYLDNTYCEPACCHPEKESAIKKVVELCESYSDKRIMLGTSWIGHEDLLVEIAIKLKEYIFVDNDTMNRLKYIGVLDVFRIGSSHRLNAVSNNRLTSRTIAHWNSEMPTVGIKPTAMFGNEVCTVPNSNGKLIIVPYSNHCNYQELCQFVKAVAPVFITPIVRGRNAHAGMESFFRSDMRQFDHCLTLMSLDAVCSLATPSVDRGMFFVAESSKQLISMKNSTRKRRYVSTSSANKVSKKRGVIFDSADEKQVDNKRNLRSTCLTSPKTNMDIENSLKVDIEKEILLNIGSVFNKL